MASLIKNQILKHLSKFAKNLSPDKLQLSTLKGHCELHNLELDEIMLTDLLELPTWLKLSQAVCNHVTLKIHWTKLKSVPIYLSLDEVLVNMETCEELRPPSPSTGHSSYSSGGKYGFSDRVIDGMTVVANSVVINFKSPAFQASFQLSRVVLESYSPDWKKKDMRLSRIKDTERGEILLFKRLEWQVLRIEATSKQNGVKGVHLDVPLTPLRLITNQACCKITFKKRLIDSTLIGSRLILILDDLIWVLTDAQLVAALHFLQSLSGLIQSATQVTQKAKAKHKLEQNPEKHQHSSLHSKSNSRFSSLFTHHDVVETSQHLLCSRIDLHLCDDLDPKDGRSQHPNLSGGGALQVSLHKLVVDYYPYHHAFNSREHWLRYTEPSSGRNAWVQQLLTQFYEYFPSKSMQIDFFDSDLSSGKAENSKHIFAHRSSSVSSPTRKSTINFRPEEKLASIGKSSGSFSSSDLTSDENKNTNVDQNRKLSLQWNVKFLMSNCIVLRLEEFTVYKVSTSTASKKHSLEKFMASNRSVHLPPDMKTIHMELTTYYLPGDLTLPVPSPNLFLHFGPVQMIFDPSTILWLNAFQLNLQKCLVIKTQTVQSSSPVNIRIEFLMPQITFPTDKNAPTDPERPKSLHLRASRIIVTNCRIGDHASQAHLAQCLKVLKNSSLFLETAKYPWSIEDMKPMAGRFLQQLTEQGSLYEKLEQEKGTDSALNSPVVHPVTLPKNFDCDIWSIHLDPCWADFAVCDSGRTRLHAFIDPLPLTMWFYNQKDPSTECSSNSEENKLTQSPIKTETCTVFSEGHYKNDGLSESLHDALPLNNSTITSQNTKNEANMYFLVHVHSLLNVQMNHYHYLFLLRLFDSITELSTQVSYDTSIIIKGKPPSSACITALWPQIEVSVILRNLNQMSATSDSVDLASLQEDCSSPSEIAHPSKRSFQASQSSFSMMECDIQSKQTHVNKCTGAFDNSCIENGLPKSCSDSLLNCHSPPASHSSTPPPAEAPNSSEKTTDTLHKGIQSGTSAMKRGFCSLVASIDSAFTKNETNNSADLENTSFPDEDTLSLRSDFSSDLDHFVICGQESVDDDFAHYHVNEEVDVEMATEMKEDTISNYTLNSEKKREMISVTTFKLSGLECVQQLTENTSNLLVTCNHVETTEHPAISWENFQNTFSSRSRGWKADKQKYTSTECRLRFTSVNHSPEERMPSKNVGYLSLLASNLHLCLLMSSVSGLVDFFEDEVISQPFPARIILNNFKVQLQGDQCPTTLASSAIPIHINLPGCFLERTHDGIVNILPLPTDYIKNELNPSVILNPKKSENIPSESLIGDTSGNAMLLTSLLQADVSACTKNSSLAEIKDTALHNEDHFNNSVCNMHLDNSKENKSLRNILAENEELKTKLTSFHMLQTENEFLKKELHLLKNVKDTNELKDQLLEARREIRRIEDEKKTLRETLKLVQNELSRLEDERNITGVK